MNFLLVLMFSLAHFPSWVMNLQFICAAGKRVWGSEPHRLGSDASCVIRCYDSEQILRSLCTYPKSCSEEQTCHVTTRVVGTINPQQFFIIITVIIV